MKAWHWILAVVVLYEILVGAAELMNTSGTSPLGAIVSWPSVGSLVQGQTPISTSVAGGVDLGTAALIYFFVLHDHLFAHLMGQ